LEHSSRREKMRVLSNHSDPCPCFKHRAVTSAGFGRENSRYRAAERSRLHRQCHLPLCRSVSIRGDRILAVGKNRSILLTAGPSTRRIDLGGRLVIPGINDSHVHFEADVIGTKLNLGEDPDPSWRMFSTPFKRPSHTRRTEHCSAASSGKRPFLTQRARRAPSIDLAPATRLCCRWTARIVA
jgi:hypothetical protein